VPLTTLDTWATFSRASPNNSGIIRPHKTSVKYESSTNHELCSYTCPHNDATSINHFKQLFIGFNTRFWLEYLVSINQSIKTLLRNWYKENTWYHSVPFLNNSRFTKKNVCSSQSPLAYICRCL
jgi:hypothetical protein